MSSTWQHPFVNILKTYKVAQKHAKIQIKGDVLNTNESSIRSTCWHICGKIPANNFIQIPKDPVGDNLQLIGRFFYLLYKPIAGTHFIFHLEINTGDDNHQTVRISISNLFKEYKCTHSTVLFPILLDEPFNTVNGISDHSQKIPDGKTAPPKSSWTMLCLDLKSILAIHLNRKYGSLKSVKICSNIILKSAFTSDVEYNPIINPTEARSLGIRASNEELAPMPRDMNFLMNKNQIWDDHFQYIRFPNTKIAGPYNVIRRGELTAADYFSKGSILKKCSDLEKVYLENNGTDPNEVNLKPSRSQLKIANSSSSQVFQRASPTKKSKIDKSQRIQPLVTEIPNFGYLKTKQEQPENLMDTNSSPLDTTDSFNKVRTTGALSTETHIYFDKSSIDPNLLIDERPKNPSSCPVKEGKREIQNYLDQSRGVNNETLLQLDADELTFQNQNDIENQVPHSKQEDTDDLLNKNSSIFDVDLKIDSVFGFSTYTKKANRNQVIIHPNGIDSFYAAGNAVVRLTGRKQSEILTGHSGPVACLTINREGTLLISAQANPEKSYSMLRIWKIHFSDQFYNISHTTCVSNYRIPHTDLSAMAISYDNSMLAALGKLKAGIQYILLWDISNVCDKGDVRVFAKSTVNNSTAGSIEGLLFIKHLNKLITYGYHLSKDDLDQENIQRDQGSCLKMWSIRSGSLACTNLDILAKPEICSFKHGNKNHFEHKYKTAGLHITGADEKNGTLICCFKGGYFLVIDVTGDIEVNKNDDPSKLYRKIDYSIKERHLLDPVGRDHLRHQEIKVPLSCLKISENFNFIAVGASDGMVRLISLSEAVEGKSIFGEVILEAEHDGPIQDLVVEPRNRWLLVSTNCSIGELDIVKRKYNTISRAHTNRIANLSVDSLRRRVVTIGEDSTIRIWCLDSRQQIFDFTVEDSKDKATCCDLHYHEPLLLIGFRSGFIRCFRLHDCSTTLEFEVRSGMNQSVIQVCFTPTTDDLVTHYRYLVLSNQDLVLYSRDETIRQLVNSVYFPNENTKTFLKCSLDNRYLAIRSKKSTIALYRPATLDLCFKISLKTSKQDFGSPIQICFGTTSPCELLYVLTDKNTLLTFWVALGHSNNLMNRRFDFSPSSLANQPPVGSLLSFFKIQSPSVITNISISEDNKTLFTTCQETIRVWNLLDNEKIIKGEDPNQMNIHENGQVCIYDKLLSQIPVVPSIYKDFYSCGTISNLQLLLDQKTLVTSSDGCLFIHKYEKGPRLNDDTFIIKGADPAPSEISDKKEESTDFNDRNFDTNFVSEITSKNENVNSKNQNEINDNINYDIFDPVIHNRESKIELISNLNVHKDSMHFSRVKFRKLEEERSVMEKTYVSKNPAIEVCSSFGFNGNYGRRNICWGPRGGFLLLFLGLKR